MNPIKPTRSPKIDVFIYNGRDMLSLHVSNTSNNLTQKEPIVPTAKAKIIINIISLTLVNVIEYGI